MCTERQKGSQISLCKIQMTHSFMKKQQAKQVRPKPGLLRIEKFATFLRYFLARNHKIGIRQLPENWDQKEDPKFKMYHITTMKSKITTARFCQRQKQPSACLFQVSLHSSLLVSPISAFVPPPFTYPLCPQLCSTRKSSSQPNGNCSFRCLLSQLGDKGGICSEHHLLEWGLLLIVLLIGSSWDITQSYSCCSQFAFTFLFLNHQLPPSFLSRSYL